MIHGPLISRGTSGADLAGGGGEREAGRLVRCLIKQDSLQEADIPLKAPFKADSGSGAGREGQRQDSKPNHPWLAALALGPSKNTAESGFGAARAIALRFFH